MTEEHRPDEPADSGAVEEVGQSEPPEPLPDDVARKALSGDPEAEALVEQKWEEARSMEGEAPTG